MVKRDKVIKEYAILESSPLDSNPISSTHSPVVSLLTSAELHCQSVCFEGIAVDYCRLLILMEDVD
jgi:hypothetical protein